MTTPPARAPILGPPARQWHRRDRSGTTRRDEARARVRWISRAVAIVAAGAAAVLGLVVSKEIPGTTASVHATSSTTSTSAPTASSAASQPATAGAGSSSSGTSATTAATTTPTTATTTPSSTTKSATVVSGGTGS